MPKSHHICSDRVLTLSMVQPKQITYTKHEASASSDNSPMEWCTNFSRRLVVRLRHIVVSLDKDIIVSVP